jgi:hypothetical protein
VGCNQANHHHYDFFHDYEKQQQHQLCLAARATYLQTYTSALPKKNARSLGLISVDASASAAACRMIANDGEDLCRMSLGNGSQRPPSNRRKLASSFRFFLYNLKEGYVIQQVSRRLILLTT